MKNSSAILVLSLSILLAGCVTYSNQKSAGTYTYKGVEYDVYEVIESNRNVGPIEATEELNDDFDYNRTLVLVKKGAGTPSSAANAISSCRLSGESRAKNLERCRKVFGAALERRLNPVEEESGSSY